MQNEEQKVGFYVARRTANYRAPPFVNTFIPHFLKMKQPICLFPYFYILYLNAFVKTTWPQWEKQFTKGVWSQQHEYVF